MKKTVVFFIILFTFLCGCNNQFEASEYFSLPMQMTVISDGSNTEFIVYIQEDQATVFFEEGHALSGTVLHFSESGNVAEIGTTLKCDIKKGIFPAQESLIKAVSMLSSTEQIGVPKGNAISYTIDETEIIVYYDKNSDSITRIETEEGGKRFGFTVVSLIPDEEQSGSDYTS